MSRCLVGKWVDLDFEPKRLPLAGRHVVVRVEFCDGTAPLLTSCWMSKADSQEPWSGLTKSARVVAWLDEAEDAEGEPKRAGAVDIDCPYCFAFGKAAPSKAGPWKDPEQEQPDTERDVLFYAKSSFWVGQYRRGWEGNGGILFASDRVERWMEIPGEKS